MNYLKKIATGVGRWRALPVLVLILAMVFPLLGCGENSDDLSGTIKQGQELLGDLSTLMEDAKNLIGDVADAIDSPDSMVDAREILDGSTDTGNTLDQSTDIGNTLDGLTNAYDTSDDVVPPADSSKETSESASTVVDEKTLDRDGSYTSKADVALYIHIYGELPGNFMTKKEAEALGWSGGSLEKYAEGMSIGGDSFGNYEGILPKAKGRTYKECDIDTLGKKSRGAKRIVFSNDGLVYYTEDHYESFELLYGEEQ